MKADTLEDTREWWRLTKELDDRILSYYGFDEGERRILRAYFERRIRWALKPEEGKESLH